MTDTRQLAHNLIDQLPDAQLSGLVRFLESIVDPVAAALRDAPLEDEVITDDEEHAAAEARGTSTVPHEEAMRRIGLA